MKTRTMTRTQAELLLAAVIIARSTSYVLTKVGLQDMGKSRCWRCGFCWRLHFWRRCSGGGCYRSTGARC